MGDSEASDEEVRLQRLFKAAEGLDLILIGGQSTALWASAYGLRQVTTKDLDWQGTPEDAETYAQRLGLKLLRNNGMDGHFGIILVPVEGAESFVVDFLTSSLGVSAHQLRERARVATALGTSFRVMHPVHLVISRCVNLVDAARASRRVSDLAQARTSITSCEAFLHANADADARLTRKMVKALLEFCRRIEAKRCWQEHAVDAFDSVRPWISMDADFRERTYPKWRLEVDRRFGK